MNSCIKYIFSFHSPPLSSSSPPPPSPCLLLLAAWQCWKVKKLLLLENWFYDFLTANLHSAYNLYWIGCNSDDRQQLKYCGTSILTKGNTSLYPPKICKYCSTSVLKYCSTCLLTSSIAWEIMCGASREVTAPICKDGKDLTNIPDHQKQTRSSTQCEQH